MASSQEATRERTCTRRRLAPRLLAVAIAPVALLCGCLGADEPVAPSTSQLAARSAPEGAGADLVELSSIEGIADFVDRGLRPDQCPDLDAAPPPVVDPRAVWLTANRRPNTVDGVTTTAADGTIRSVWVELMGGGEPVASLHMQDGAELLTVPLTVPVVSVAVEGNRVAGLALVDDGVQLVELTPEGIEVVALLEGVAMASDLVVDGETSWYVDRTGEVDGSAGEPQLVQRHPSGRITELGAPSRAAAASVDRDHPVISVASEGGVEAERTTAETLGTVDVPARWIGESTWLVSNPVGVDHVVVHDGAVLGCARRHGRTAVDAYRLLHGGTGD